MTYDNIEFKVSKAIQTAIPEGRWKYKVRAAESHLSYFHIEKLIEIVRVFGVGIA